MSTYTKFTIETFQSKLRSGGYKTLAGACRAAGRSSQLTKNEREQCKEEARLYFQKPTRRKSKKVRVSFSKKAGAAVVDQRLYKQVPLAVTFHRACSDKGKKGMLLQLVRAAVDEGLTLPTLLEMLEAV